MITQVSWLVRLTRARRAPAVWDLARNRGESTGLTAERPILVLPAIVYWPPAHSRAIPTDMKAPDRTGAAWTVAVAQRGRSWDDVWGSSRPWMGTLTCG